MKKTCNFLKANLVFLVGGILSSANAFDYGVSGTAGSFTKWGFNNQQLIREENQAPTESFVSIFGQLNLNMSLNDYFTATLGGSLGGLAYDSSAKADKLNGDGLTANESAFFGASIDDMRANRRPKQNYIMQNANIKFATDNFYLRAGRFENGTAGKKGNEKLAEFFSGYAQGAEGYAKFSDFKIWGFWANRRAFAYPQWFNNFWRVHGLKQDIFAAGVNYEGGVVNGNIFAYYVDSKVVAPGLGLTIDTNPEFDNSGVRSYTRLRVLLPQAQGSWVGAQSGRNWGEVNKSSASIWLEERVDVNIWHFGVGVYKNFGNANELIGRYGNPVLSVMDTWVGGSYDIGQALSDIWAKDATTGYFYFGADYGAFDWRILSRATNAPRSAEQSVALSVSWQARDDIKVGGKLEWQSDTTKAGYSPLAGYFDDEIKLEKKRTDDRSHLYFYISHNF